MANKEIAQGHDARTRIKRGIDKACDAVRPTLGPIGMTAMIEFRGLDPIECDDGVTILRNIELADAYEQMGVQKLRKAAVRTSTEGGDGTATTTVLTQALVDEAFKEIATNSSKIPEVRKRLQDGLKECMYQLGKMKREVKESDIERIATISSLDPEIAKHIADIIKEVGINGVVTVEKGAKLGYFREIVKGARFDKGLISPYFINSPDTGECILDDAYIVLVDRKVSLNEQIIPLLQAIGTGKSILLIADDVDGVALGTLVANAMKGIAKIGVIRNPFSASAARDFLLDMAALTGGAVISEEMGMKLSEQNDAGVCGRAEKIIINRDTTTIIGGKSNDKLKDRIAAIEKELTETTSEFEKERLGDRLAALTGGIGVIRVGAYTDTEFNTKKYKFENAINATQAALQEGILPGGGSALARIEIKDPIFSVALLAPIKQMATNAGMDAFQVAHNVRFPNLSPDNAKGMGYDFKTQQFVDLYEKGVIDPFKVTRLALESAVSIAESLINVETSIVNEVKQKEDERH